MQDYVAPHRLNVRTCSASGTKFFDLDADGVRDRGEPGIPRFIVWADYDNDGVRDPIEPFGISDRRGQYVVHDIQPPGGTYMLRERLLPRRPGVPPVSDAWNCSFPNNSTPGGTGSARGGQFGCAWGPIDVRTTPNATGKNFGNWFPARLTIAKELEPSTDGGRFDLLVNGRVAVAAAGDGASRRLELSPGTYTVAERAVPPTNAADYQSSVSCRTQTRRGERRAVAQQQVRLVAGRRVTCTFHNVRPGSPAIAIEKFGPDLAIAGDTLRYRLEVSNPGSVAFRAADVVVRDPDCDGAPQLVDKEDGSGTDDTPRTLDPGDMWIYRCSRRTSDRGADCEQTRVVNQASVSGSAGGATVTDTDDISTILLCPDQPEPPDPVPPDPPGPEPPLDPDVPGPVVPPGPVPPNSGDAARAGAALRRAVSGCIRSHVPRVNLQGTRIARIRVYVNGRLRRGLNVRTLQQRVRPRVTLAPGRYRVTARVTFQRGTDSPPVTLSGVLRICGASAPRFTG